MGNSLTSAILIPWAQTDWHVAGRYASRAPVSINAQGEEEIGQWARLLQQHQAVAFYSTEKGAGEETARRLAELLHVKAKKSANLAEVSLGLWEGLTPQQLKKRFAKAYKQWKENPSSVCPPDGEDLADAGDRLASQIKKIAKKHDGECFGVVLGPLAFPAVRCVLEEKDYSAFWEIPLDVPVKYFINLEENKAILTA